MNDFLTPLRLTEDLPPSKVDIARAVRDGRRRERNRMLLAAAACVVVGAVVIGATAFAADRRPAPPPADEFVLNGCEVQRLPTSGTFAAASNQYLAGALDGTILLWSNGTLRQIEDAPQPDPTPAAVNDSGAVVGNSGDNAPWLMQDGRFTPLATPPDTTRVSVAAINANGFIVGTAWTPDSKARIVRWNVAHPDQVEYVTTSPAVAYAAGIGADGTIVGRGQDAPGDFHAYAWTADGTPMPLNRANGRPAGGASAIAGDWAVGSYEDGSTWFDQGVRWNLRTGEAVDLGTFVPSGVDTTGRMFGVLMNGVDETPPAWWKNGEVLLLPVLSAGESATVSSMSPDGQTAAGWLYRAKNDPVTPVRWRC
ncbi:hypothetical protein [Dactylosporangium sp. NPDC051541]|uniref:hypothetical protein n=1 Tax=Dactylosporangium sp. NPDC051541 TaxID=3363977 RepID=UPI0037BB5797